MDINERKDILYSIRDHLRRNAEELAYLECLNAGLPLQSVRGHVQRMARNFEFFGAPVGIFFVIDRRMGRGQWAHLGMFMQTLALAALDRGLATCMQEFWGSLRETLHRHFALPETDLIYCGMALGYADPDTPVNQLRSARAPVDEFAILRGF